MSRRQILVALVAGLIVLAIIGPGLYPRGSIDEPSAPAPQPVASPGEIEPSVVPSIPSRGFASAEEETSPALFELMTQGLPIEGCDEKHPASDLFDNEQEYERIMRSAVDLLSESGDPEYLLAAALMDFDPDERAESQLLARAAGQLPDHPVALWHRLQHCRNGSCDRGEIARAAVAADPTNGMLWLEIARGHLRDGDWPGAERAMRQAIASSRFDSYFIDYTDLLERGLAASTDFNYTERMVVGIGISAAVAVPLFGEVSRACQSEDNDMVVWVPLCDELGMSMHERSTELISTMVGWGYRKAAAERTGDSARAKLLKEQSAELRERYLTRMHKVGASALLENDPMILRQYFDDFRAHSELQAVDRLVEVAERLRADPTYDQCNFVRRSYEPS